MRALWRTGVVGAPSKYSSAGAVYVFTQSGTSWAQQAELTASGGAISDPEFGTSVALSGTTAVVGARFSNSGTGAAYVYTGSGASWAQQAELTASDGASGDEFGTGVALSGTTVVVGAPGKNSATGAAYVFTVTGCAAGQAAHVLTANTNAGQISGLFCVDPKTGVGTYTQDPVGTQGSVSGTGDVEQAFGVTLVAARGTNLALLGLSFSQLNAFIETAPIMAKGTFSLG